MQVVADIGGTNSRFALCEPGSVMLQEPRKYPNADFASLEQVMQHFLEDTGAKPSAACLAVAGPAHGQEIRLTNIDWHFRKAEFTTRFDLKQLVVTNDFTALAMAIPHLQPENYVQVGSGQAVAGQPIAVLGPGTGLGVSGLIPNEAGWIALQGEGGNSGFCPSDVLEAELYQRAAKEKGFVRSEDFISGIGMTYLHDLLLEIDGQPRAGLEAQEINWRARTSSDDPCRHTVNVFCGMLGSMAGNLAMTLGALGGVYIGGGVVPQLEALFEQSPFRERFEDKGRFAPYVKPIPTFALHAHSRYALMGAAALLAQTRES